MFKNLIIGLMFTGSAFADPSWITLQHHNFVDLNVDKPSVRLNIGYPGYQGKTCKLELRANYGYGSEKAMKKFAEEVQVAEVGFHSEPPVELAPEFTHNVVKYPFKTLSTYMILVDVKTRSGKSLKEVISATIPSESSESEKKTAPTVIGLLRNECK